MSHLQRCILPTYKIDRIDKISDNFIAKVISVYYWGRLPNSSAQPLLLTPGICTGTTYHQFSPNWYCVALAMNGIVKWNPTTCVPWTCSKRALADVHLSIVVIGVFPNLFVFIWSAMLFVINGANFSLPAVQWPFWHLAKLDLDEWASIRTTSGFQQKIGECSKFLWGFYFHEFRIWV